ncbi:MAG: hypothetical protein HY292_02635 [Planctomycetes bacterium]|nr:hypothetical protein [Planctomycetota bacterium]
MGPLLLVAFAAALLGDDDARDVVTLKAGGKLEGRVVVESNSKVVLRASSRERTIPNAEILSVTSVARSMAEWLAKRQGLRDDDVAGHLDLAAFCKERKLDDEAKIEAYVVLRADPSNEKAHEILGHRRNKNTWFVAVDGGPVAWSLVDKVTADWGKAFEVESEHYAVRTDAGVVAAVDLLIDLESYYRAFDSFLGGDLELREVLEPMSFYAYKNRAEFPGAGGVDGGLRPGLEFSHPAAPWRILPKKPTDPRTRLARAHPLDGRITQVYYDAVPGRPVCLFDAATHILLDSMFEREQSGRVPAWIAGGFGAFFDVALIGPPGKPVFTADAVDHKRFADLASATKAAHLTRIINDQESDFTDTRNRLARTSSLPEASNRVLRSNEAYALVHFLMHGENGTYREKLGTYLKVAFKSNASPAVFEHAMDKDLDTVEKEWRAYVAEKAK